MSKNGSKADSNGALVPAVDRAAQILKQFHSADEALGVSELSRRLDLNKSTLHNILNTLAHHDLLERDERSRTYRLGYGLFTLGSRVQGRMELVDVARQYSSELAHQVEETVLLGVFRDEHVYIVDQQEAPHDLKISAPVGQRMPFNAGVFSLIFCAAMPQRQLSKLLRKRGLRAFTQETITSQAAFRKMLSGVRAQGYATEHGQFVEGVSAVAAPVVDASGHVLAALCVVAPSARLPDERVLRVAQKACAVAHEISRRLGATTYPAWNGLG